MVEMPITECMRRGSSVTPVNWISLGAYLIVVEIPLLNFQLVQLSWLHRCMLCLLLSLAGKCSYYFVEGSKRVQPSVNRRAQ